MEDSGEGSDAKLGETAPATMEVDTAPEKTLDKEDTKEGETGEDEFREVDDAEEQGNGNKGKTDKPMDATTASPPVEETKVKEEIKGGEDTMKEGESQDAEVLLVNPLFGKKDVPVIDIESSSSSDDGEGSDDEEDFSADIPIDNFQRSEEAGDKDAITGADGEATGGELPQRPLSGKYCGCDCYHEKGILVNEIERLRKAVFELNERHSVLEDFIEVEYSDRFEKFLKNREHLVSMGFGGTDSEGSADVIDGKRSAKSTELIELLKMIKDQAIADAKEEAVAKSSTSSQKPVSSTSSKSGGGGSSSNQQKVKSIPNITPPRDRGRGGGGRGGALSYDQRSVMVPNAAYAMNMNYQYQQQQQQQLLARQQQKAQAQMAYYGGMYGNGSLGMRDEREFVSVVGRTQLYPDGFRYENKGGLRGGSEETKESKKQRKRKRQSEVSSEASTVGSQRNAGNSSSGGGGGGGKGAPKPNAAVEDDDVQVIDYSQGTNQNAKRICPLCEKIINRKQLRDHLSIVHQGHKVACPVCNYECMYRRSLKTHMRDSHDLPVSEYTTYMEKVYSSIEEQCGPWLDKLMKEAEIPTKDQLLLHNAEVQLAILARREERATAGATGGSNPLKPSTSSAPSTSSRGGGRGGGSGKAATASARGGGAGGGKAAMSFARGGGGGGARKNTNQDRDHPSRNRTFKDPPVRYFTGANSKMSSGRAPQISTELYGPGGYAQYAARYLQERAYTEGRSSGGSGGGRLYNPF